MTKEVKKDAAALMFEEILKSFSMHEYEARTKAVKKAMQRKAEQGYSQYRPPVGYKVSDVKGLYKLTRHGKYMSGLMKQFADGVITKEHFYFNLCLVLHNSPKHCRSLASLKSLISNPYYAGFVSHNGELYQGKHEPLVTQQEQQSILEKLTD